MGYIGCLSAFLAKLITWPNGCFVRFNRDQSGNSPVLSASGAGRLFTL